MRASEGTIVWPRTSLREGGPWLLGRGADLAFVLGPGSFVVLLVAALATRAVPAAAPLVVALFLRLAILCNHPHYAATYDLVARGRGARPEHVRWTVGSAIAAAALLAAGVARPSVVPLVERAYLTWSAYHYAAQHFGVACLYEARAGAPLPLAPKRLLRAAFVLVGAFPMVLLNTPGGIAGGERAGAIAFGQRVLATPFDLPQGVFPFALALPVLGLGAWAGAERAARARRGTGLSAQARWLVASNLVWFAVPYLRPTIGAVPWVGPDVARFWPYTIPFFHCSQYLAVVGFRSRLDGPVRPVFRYAALVGVGLVLFEVTGRVLERTFPLPEEGALVLLVSVINLHHFFVDGLVWRSKRPARAAAQA